MQIGGMIISDGDYFVYRVTPVYFPRKGGSVTHVYELSVHLAGSVRGQVIICPKYPEQNDESDKAHEIEIVRLPSTMSKINVPFQFLLDLVYYSFNIAKHLLENHGRSATDGKVKYVVHAHGLDLGLFTNLMMKLFRIKVPLILMVHGSPTELWRMRPGVKIMRVIRYAMLLVFPPKHYVQLDDGQIDPSFFYFLDRIGVPHSVVQHAVDLEFYTPRRHAPDKFTVLSLARLDPFKRVDIALQVFKEFNQRCPDTILRLVGDGEERERLESLMRSMGLSENVEFLGFLSRDETLEAIRESSVVISTSPFSNLNRSLIESAACGVPSVMFADQHSRGAFQDNLDSVMVSFNDVQGMVGRLIELYHDREKLEELGRNARITVERTATWRDRCEEEIGIYRSALG